MAPEMIALTIPSPENANIPLEMTNTNPIP